MSDGLSELARVKGGEVREVYGARFARFRDEPGRDEVLAAADGDGIVRQWRAPMDESAVLAVARLLDASAAASADDVAWLLAGFPGWERLDDDAYDVVDDWLAPTGGTRSVINLGGNAEPRAQFALGRRTRQPLVESGEMVRVSFGARGSARVNRSTGDITAPDVIASLAERFGAEAAGNLWRARPDRVISWPQPPTTRSQAVMMMSRRPPAQLRRVDVGPFTWLELGQDSGSRKRALAELTVVDGEALVLREYETYHAVPSENVHDPFVVEGALEALVLSAGPERVALDDVKALLPLLHLGAALETEDEVRALCAERRTQQHGRRGPYTTTEPGLSEQALAAWHAPFSDGEHIGCVTHLATDAIGVGSNIQGVFDVRIRLRPTVTADVTRVCDGLKPPAMYVG